MCFSAQALSVGFAGFEGMMEHLGVFYEASAILAEFGSVGAHAVSEFFVAVR
jgi:hypothetical protein